MNLKILPPEVVSLLFQEGVVISKVSNGKKKYAVNPSKDP